MPYCYEFNRIKAGKRHRRDCNKLSLRFTTPSGTSVTLEVDQSALARACKVVAALDDCTQRQEDVLLIPGEYSEHAVDHLLSLLHRAVYEPDFEVKVPQGWAAFAGNAGPTPGVEPLAGEGFLENHYWELALLADYLDACDGLTGAVDRLWAGHGAVVTEEGTLADCDYAHPGRWLARASQLAPRYPVTFDTACAACIRLPPRRWLEVLYTEEMRHIDREILFSILAGREVATFQTIRAVGVDPSFMTSLRHIPRMLKTSPMHEVFVSAAGGQVAPSSDGPDFIITLPCTGPLYVTKPGDEEVYHDKIEIFHHAVMVSPNSTASAAVVQTDAAPHPWRMHVMTLIQWNTTIKPRPCIIPVKHNGLAFAAHVDVTWQSGEVTSAQVTPPHLPPVTQAECDPAGAAKYRPRSATGCHATMGGDWWGCDIFPPSNAADPPIKVHLVVKFELNFAGF